MDIKKDPCLFKYDQLPVSMRNLEIHKVTIRRGEGEKTKGDCYAAYPSLSSYTYPIPLENVSSDPLFNVMIS